MARAFNDVYREICEVEYGVRTDSLSTYLVGQYFAGFAQRRERNTVEVAWTVQHTSQIANLVRTKILPRTVELYQKELGDQDALTLLLPPERGTRGYIPLDNLVVGHIAFDSTSLTPPEILDTIQPPFSLRPIGE